MLSKKMYHQTQLLRRTGALLIYVSWCALAGQTAFADNASTTPPANPPNLSIPTPDAQLRPVPSTEASSTPSASATTPTPSTADSTEAAPTQSPGPSQNAELAQSPILAATTPSLTAPEPATAPPDPAATNAQPAPASIGEANAWKNSYVNLINILVNRGVLTKKDSSSLIDQAQSDAKAANSAQAQAAAALASHPAPPNPDNDTMQVAYVPETVKEQMRDEIKRDVMQQAKDENWAAPDSTPEWVKRYHVTSDIRVRYEGEEYPSSNDSQGAFHNFNAINTSTSAFDVGSASLTQNPPYYNVNQDRNFFRLRARIGADVDIGQGFTAGLRIATGNDDSPVSENQTFGSANGQGGQFSKYAIWLDRAFLRYELGAKTNRDLTVTLGRFDNPFFSTTMLWADDLAFDGLAAKGKYEVTPGVVPFLTAGAFPIYNTDLNFGTYNSVKFPSENKWLFATQAGTDWKISDDFSFKGAVAYYDFENVAGQVSNPCDPLFATDSENTDGTRPSFAQNGNTYIALRNITPSADNGFGTTNQYQYFGLATGFHDLDLMTQLDYHGFDPIHISLIGEYVRNLAFNADAISNNGPPLLRGPVNNVNGNGSFVGGNEGYNISLKVGHPTLSKMWDWNVVTTYRYLQSDATIDGFNDSDFGGSLAGTNLQGYIVGGNLSLTSHVWLSLKWMSAQAIVGPPFQNNLIMFDVNAKF